MKKLSCVLVIFLFSFLSYFSPLVVFAEDVSYGSTITTIDTMYTKIIKKIPRISDSNKSAHKIQERFRSTLQLQLQKKIPMLNGDDLLIYQTLLIKIQQRSFDFQFSTSDILFQLQLIDATNRARRENHLPELQYSVLLSMAAYHHAIDMYNNFPNKAGEVLSHYGTDGTTVKERAENVGYLWSVLAENIAWNQTTIDEVMKDWMNSPSHRENILSDKVTEIGIAKIGPYRVQNFGKPKKNK